MFFMMQVIDFLIAIIESTADIHWSIEFITAVLKHLSQALFSTELERFEFLFDNLPHPGFASSF